MILCALVLTCCAVPNMGAIRKALDAGKPGKALGLAKHSERSLDFMAREILRGGALDVDARQEAMVAIGRARVHAKSVLVDLAAAEDPVLRAWAQSLLFKMGDRTFEADLLDALDSDLGLVRAAAVDGLLTQDQSPGFHEHYMLDTDPEVRLAVVSALVSRDLPWCQDLLLEAVRKDPDRAVRLAAVRGLDPESEGGLEVLKELLESEDREQRIAAASTLGSSAGSVDLTWAAHLLALPASEEGIHFAVALLGVKQKPKKGGGGHVDKARKYLEEAIKDPSPTIRLAAVVTLAGAGKGVDGIDGLASDPSAQVRVAWCRLTRKLGTSEAGARLEILEVAVQDGDARDALVTIAEEKGGYDRIRDKVWWMMIKGDGGAKRYVLVHAIRPFGDPWLALFAMKDKDPAVRLEAAASWLTR